MRDCRKGPDCGNIDRPLQAFSNGALMWIVWPLHQSQYLDLLDLVEGAFLFCIAPSAAELIAPLGHFLSIDSNIFRGGNGQSHLIAAGCYNFDTDTLANNNLLPNAPG
jgi:hypothetical protein